MNMRSRRRSDRLARMEEALSTYRGREGRHPRAPLGVTLQRLTAMAVAIGFALFLVSFGLATVTTKGTAEHIIARSIPTITEQDLLLAIHGAELRDAAKQTNEKSIPFAGFPVSITLSSTEVARASSQQLAAAVDRASAQAIYQRGVSAFIAPGGRATIEPGSVLSPTWTLHQVLGLLNARGHLRYVRSTVALAIATIVLAALFCTQVRGYGRFVGLGVTGIAASIIAGVLTLLAWLVVQFYYSGASSPLAAAAWDMMADITWTMVLIDLFATVSAIGLLIVGVLFASLEREDVARTLSPASADRVAGPRRGRYLD